MTYGRIVVRPVLSHFIAFHRLICDEEQIKKMQLTQKRFVDFRII
jgi:hypothetical protein